MPWNLSVANLQILKDTLRLIFGKTPYVVVLDYEFIYFKFTIVFFYWMFLIDIKE